MRLAIALVTIGLGFANPLSGQIVRGQVVDSITSAPIQGVVLVLLDRTRVEVSRTHTDEEGLFLLRARTAGRYRIRATHDTYRESTFPPFELADEEVKAFILLVPPTSAPEPPDITDVIDYLCPDDAHAGQPILYGRLTNSRGEPTADAELVIQWSALPDALTGFTDDAISEGIALSGPTGYYAVCGAPRFTNLTVLARRDDLQSGRIRIVFGRTGVFVGNDRHPMPTVLWRRDFQLLAENERTAAVTGSVMDVTGIPVANAAISIVGTDFRARTDDAGAFSLVRLPPGPAQVEVRRLGFKAARAAVELELDSVVALSDSAFRLEAAPTQLASVVVTAAMHAKRDLVGFTRRREQGRGRFITREAFMEEGYVPQTSEVLRKVGGFRVRAGENFTPIVYSMRRGPGCFPLVFRDNLYLGTADPDQIPNLDAAVPLEQIDAIEVYATGSLPPEFNRIGSTCGALVFWTIPPRGLR